MKIEIYSKDHCGYCSMAIKLTEMRKLDAVVKKLDVDFTREQLLEQFPAAKTFPIVVVDDQLIGGYTDFMQYLKQN